MAKKDSKAAGSTEVGQTLEVRQIRSQIGRPFTQHRTLAALGLGRIGKVKIHRAEPSVLGMLQAVSHLVAVRPISK